MTRRLRPPPSPFFGTWISWIAWALGCAIAVPLAAEARVEDREINLKDQQAAEIRFLDDLAGNQGSGGMAQRERMRQWAELHPPQLTRGDFVRAGKSPYSTNRVLESAGLFAAIGAATAGTVQQAVQAAFLARISGLMAGSQNQQIVRAAQILSAEASALQQGDAAAAAAQAALFATMTPSPIAPGYAPAQDEQTLSAALKVLTAYDWGSTFMALGQAVMAAVLGAIQGGVYGAIVGAAVSLIASAALGDFTSHTSTLQPSGEGQPGPALAQQTSQGDWLQNGPGQVGLQTSGVGAAPTIGKAGAATLNVPAGAAGVSVQSGKGSASGGVLVGAQALQ